jgi:uncharacterized protein
MRRFLLSSIALLVVLIPQLGYADFPKPTGYVNDYAGVIQAGTRTKLEGVLQGVEKKTGVEIAVVTIPSLEERPIEDYAVDLYQQWGIGKKGKDEGALILVAPHEKRVRIEVGYGLEGALNDAQAGRIIRDLMIPYFKEGDFTRGIVIGAQAVIAIALKEKGIEGSDLEGAAAAPSPARKKGGPLSVIFKILLFLVMVYLFIRHPWLFLFFLASAGRGGGMRGGGFSGGFGGFGGGLSGGGGASGRW